MEAYIRTLGVHLLDVPYHLDIEYTYYVPETLTEDFAVGSFVLVPFGGANKKLCALITSCGMADDYSRLKPVLSPINETLSLNAEMMALVRFLCDRTLCTVGDAVRRLIPAEAFSRADETYRAEPITDGEPLNLKAVAIHAYIAEHAPVTRARLEKQFGPEVRSALKSLLAAGYITADTVIKESRGATEEIAIPVNGADAGILSKPRTPEAQRRLYAEILENGRTPTRALLDAGYKSAHIKALEKKGLITLEKYEIYRNHYGTSDAVTPPAPVVLSDEQQAAYDRLGALMDEPAAKAALLYGVTGSGKTSVILALCEKAVACGKTAIVLIPEIALTAQSVAVFTARFGGKTAVVHSGLSDGERFDTFKRIRRGEVSVVLGTRSAIFAPLENIGLIVIDEEQEYTYKSDMSPKYHTRDVAKHRATAHGALLLMASATPSVESFYEAESGKYELVRLTKRYTGSALPAVKIADMRLAADGDRLIGESLRAMLRETYESGRQSMLFLNRRGYNSMLSCRACGEVALCPNCSVSLTHHKTRRGARLVCHYCGYNAPVPHYCPKCGSEHLAFAGYGTQLIEEEIASFLPEARILRMDADTTRERFSQDALVASFGRGDADILVGTQMIAKGHNFPKLALVGVVAADNSLFLDDFRANERTFSLITQVIGRAGRSDGGGIAVIQTYNPENETIRLSAAQDYDAFYRNEIAVRRGLVFPPFCDVAVFSLTAEEESELRTFAKDFTSALAEKQKSDYEDVKLLIFGPFEAPVFKVKNKYRMRVVLKFKNNRRARALFSEVLIAYGKKAQSKITLTVDINPTST